MNIIHHISKLKKKITIISIDANNSFDKIQYSFMIFKIVGKLGTERNIFNSIKNIYEKSTAHILPNSEKLRSFPAKTMRMITKN